MTGTEMLAKMDTIAYRTKVISEFTRLYKGMFYHMSRTYDETYYRNKETLRACIDDITDVIEELKTTDEVIFSQDMSREQLIENMNMSLYGMQQQESLLDKIHSVVTDPFFENL